MPARPARKFTLKDTSKKFGDVPFTETMLTADAFNAQISELTSLVVGLSGEYMATVNALEALSGEYAATVNDLETLSGELYATTPDASGDIWNLSAAIAELRPEEAAASNKR